MHPRGQQTFFEDFLEQSPPKSSTRQGKLWKLNTEVLREDPKQYIFWKVYALRKSNEASVYTVLVNGSKLLAPVKGTIELNDVLPVNLTEYMAACNLQNHHVYDHF